MTSYPIPISRPDDPKVYHSGEFLNEQTHLCMVAERLTSWPSANMFHGMPWITPVLGTGCLELGDSPSIDPVEVGAAARRWISQAHVALPRSVGDAGKVASDFVASLEADRFGDSSSLEGAADAIAVEDVTAGLALATAVLTWLYHGIRIASIEPASRWWSREEAVIRHATSADEALQPVLEAAEALLNALIRSSDPLVQTADAPVRRLLGEIAGHLREDRLPLEDVRILTEVTWLAIIEGSSIYPGWSDLLLKLVLRYSDPRAPSGVRPNLTELTHLENAVRELLGDATSKSWAALIAGDGVSPMSRGHLYRAVTSLLQQQAAIFDMLHKPDPFSDDPRVDQTALNDDYEAAERLATAVADDTDVLLRAFGDPRRASRPDIPHPSCFVTSFDLELEMTMWTDGVAFRVILPVLVSSAAPNSAELVWLIADVDPAKVSDASKAVALESLTAGPHDWHVANRVINTTAGGDRPLVVRLNGTPLFNLPDLTPPLVGELEQLGFRHIEELHHALTVDEYTSMRLSENEWFFAGQASRASDRSARRDLPDPLAAGTRTHERVWLALGVQLDDPAIRGRVFAQLSAAAVTRRIIESLRAGPDNQGRPAPSLSPDVRGIAVNRRIDEDQVAALHWLGFDLALDLDCGDLAPELDHCAHHLTQVLATLSGGEVTTTEPGDLRWSRAKEQSCGIWQAQRRNHQ